MTHYNNNKIIMLKLWLRCRHLMCILIAKLLLHNSLSFMVHHAKWNAQMILCFRPVKTMETLPFVRKKRLPTNYDLWTFINLHANVAEAQFSFFSQTNFVPYLVFLFVGFSIPCESIPEHETFPSIIETFEKVSEIFHFKRLPSRHCN